MKKILALTLSLLMIISLLAGCGGGTNKDDDAASKYPEKAVQVIIPYAPGGGSDILTRAIMDVIKLPNDQNLVAINVDGASGFTGCMQAYNSSNDGYTILAHNPMDVVSYTLSGTTQEPLYSELSLICTMVTDYNVFSTNKQSGWTTVEEVIEYAKANPGEIKIGCTGSTTVNYADTLRLLRAMEIDDCVTIVPYDGGAASKTALMGNHIQLEVNSASDIRTSVDSGDTLPLMVIGDTRAKSLPDVPCSSEFDYEITTTKPRGYYAPKGTPEEIIDALAAAMKLVSEDAGFIETCEGLGFEVVFKAADEIQPQIEGWAEQLQPVFEEILTAK